MSEPMQLQPQGADLEVTPSVEPAAADAAPETAPVAGGGPTEAAPASDESSKRKRGEEKGEVAKEETVEKKANTDAASTFLQTETPPVETEESAPCRPSRT